jgi:hypothetical protein
MLKKSLLTSRCQREELICVWASIVGSVNFLSPFEKGDREGLRSAF